MLDNQAANLSLTHRAEKAEKELEEAIEKVEILMQTVGSALRMIRYMKRDADPSRLSTLELLEKWMLEDSARVSGWDEIPF